jgi:mono/diheme cytochrome c family protein
MMAHLVRATVGLAAAGLAAFVLGCGHGGTTPTGGGPPGGMPPGRMPFGPGFGGPGGPTMKVDEKSPFAAGQKVFASNNCARCHTINGARLVRAGGDPGGFPGGGPPGGFPGKGGFPGSTAGGPPGGFPGGFKGGPPGAFKGGFPGGKSKAPDLGHVGKEPEHTVQWIESFVSNPKSVRPESKMPAFQDKIGKDDLHSLAEYLHSLQ